MIRDLLMEWNKKTFKQAIEDDIYYSIEEKKLLINILKKQGILNSLICGESVEGLKLTGDGSGPVIFSDVFYFLLDNDRLSPVTYMLELIRRYKQYDDIYHYSVHIWTLLIGRAYRSFPAFCRECQISEELSIWIPEITCYRTTPDIDVDEHTDVVVMYNNIRYNGWSYQYKDEGVEIWTVLRFMGKRGKILPGYILLLPINLNIEEHYEDVCGWKLYSKRYMLRIKKELDRGIIDDYQEVMEMDEEELSQYMRRPRIVKKEW